MRQLRKSRKWGQFRKKKNKRTTREIYTANSANKQWSKRRPRGTRSHSKVELRTA